MHVFLSVEKELLEEKAVYVLVQTLQKSTSGNACVPKCGDGATRDGDTCYCTDPTKST